jgi:hypothetical protein
MCIPLIVAKQRLGKRVPPATNTRNNRRIVGRVVFCAGRVVSKESLWIYLCILLSLLGNGSVNTFPRQRRIVRGVGFFATRVVSKESRLLVFPITTCYFTRMLYFRFIFCPVRFAQQYTLSVANIFKN